MVLVRRHAIVLLVAIVCLVATAAAPLAPALAQARSDGQEIEAEESAEERAEEEAILTHARRPWTGDLDGMRKRGFLRVLTTYNLIYYFLDGARERGIAHELSEAFEAHLNRTRPKGSGRINVVIIPVPWNELIPSLNAGVGDIVAANMTITGQRRALVDFGAPLLRDVKELVVSGPAAPEIASLGDLATNTLHLRPSSSYREHVDALNAGRRAAGKAEIPVTDADELLEDGDLLEMVDAGILPAVVVDSHMARFWDQFLPNIEVHQTLAVNADGEIAWAMRKDSPQLMRAVNAFVKRARAGTLLGNVVLNRYLLARDWLDNPLTEARRQRFDTTAEVIRRYAAEYDFDWLMIAAQGYQESGLDQSKRSHRGAIGVMQVLPSTAADPAVNIPNIEQLDANVHAGVKYLRWLRTTYFSDPAIDPIDRVLLSFAAYNAGPGNIRRARSRARRMDLNPDRWFGHVEVAAGMYVSREPVVYVRNIYKYYVAYRLALAKLDRRESVKELME